MTSQEQVLQTQSAAQLSWYFYLANEVKATCIDWDGYLEGIIEPNDHDFLDKMKTLWYPVALNELSVKFFQYKAYSVQVIKLQNLTFV